jgi:hypothetical protein
MTPATAAVSHVEIVPVNIALTATRAKSLDRLGEMAVSVPIWIPIDEMLANPHNANDIIWTVRGLNSVTIRVLYATNSLTIWIRLTYHFESQDFTGETGF